MNTRCYAVDTWEDDEHSGYNGEEVFCRVRDYNDSHYAAFSQLVCSTFDQTLTHFSDASIDLLHIDGRHFYEDVKQDFESWRPKLSERAVVLFHDTNVRERYFGVFRFWDEISRSFPSFDFLYGHGLGVLGFGVNLPKEITTFFQVTGETSVATEVRQAYAALGARWVADQQKRAYVARVEAASQKQSNLRQSSGRIRHGPTKLAAKAKAEHAQIAELKHLKAKLKNAGSIAAAMRRSISWRITKPLRLFSRGARWILRKARRALTLAWWLDIVQSGLADEGSHTPSLNLGKLPKSGSTEKKTRKSRPTTKVTFSDRILQDSLAAAKEASDSKDWPWP